MTLKSLQCAQKCLESPRCPNQLRMPWMRLYPHCCSGAGRAYRTIPSRHAALRPLSLLPAIRDIRKRQTYWTGRLILGRSYRFGLWELPGLGSDYCPQQRLVQCVPLHPRRHHPAVLGFASRDHLCLETWHPNF
jgi:hypothetical protein